MSEILFITRKFPPSVGGMENAAFQLHRALSARTDVRLIAWGGTNRLLPLAYPLLAVRAIAAAIRRRPAVVYLQDGVLAPLIWPLRVLLRLPVAMTVHGLEATYDNRLYDLVVTPAARRADRIIAVSAATADEVARWLGDRPVDVIPNGVEDVFHRTEPRDALLDAVGRATGRDVAPLRDRKLLLTTGRLVPRKGVAWFVDAVMPALRDAHPDVHYIVVGGGPDQARVQEAISRRGLEDSVSLLGRVSDDALVALYNLADAFVMPNVTVPHDMEGFGLVALEAASCGTPVIASGIEGITEAITPGRSGTLVAERDVAAYIGAIERALYGDESRQLRGASIREFVIGRHTWDTVAAAYQEKLEQTAADASAARGISPNTTE